MASSSNNVINKMRMEFVNTVEIWAVKENFDVYSDESAITKLTLSNDPSLTGQPDPGNIYTTDTHTYKFKEGIKNTNSVLTGTGIRENKTNSTEENFNWKMEQDNNLRPAFYKAPEPPPPPPSTPPEDSEDFDFSVIFIILGIIVGLGVLVLILRRFSKKQITSPIQDPTQTAERQSVPANTLRANVPP
jgi:hypothetical protein